MLGISEREIRRATIAQVAYQAACRGIIRKKGSTGEFLLLAPDQSMAEDCANIPHFQGCQMKPLITPYELPKVQPKSPGRHPPMPRMKREMKPEESRHEIAKGCNDFG